MNSFFITIFILIANVIAVALLYRSFDKNIDKNRKVFYTMLCFGAMYIIILITYFLSSLGLPKETTENAKNMITFTFVPVNIIILLPILIRSFYKRKNNMISIEQLNIRTISMIVITIVLIIGEFFYFRNIQKGIMQIVEQKQNNTIVKNNENENIYNSIVNNVEENTENNNLINNINNIENNTQNLISNYVSNNH